MNDYLPISYIIAVIEDYDMYAYIKTATYTIRLADFNYYSNSTLIL